jgi:hypothetical protein
MKLAGICGKDLAGANEEYIKMKLNILLLAMLLTILSSISWAASNEEAILGRWYYTGPVLDDEGLSLDISEDQIVFHGRITYQTEIVDDLGGGLLFKITGREMAEEDLKRIEEENLKMGSGMTAEESVAAMFGCGSSGVATYIIAEPMEHLDKFSSSVVMLYFYRGNQEPLSAKSLYICLGRSFIRESIVNSAY